jgi:hypothetical protein
MERREIDREREKEVIISNVICQFLLLSFSSIQKFYRSILMNIGEDLKKLLVLFIDVENSNYQRCH